MAKSRKELLKEVGDEAAAFASQLTSIQGTLNKAVKDYNTAAKDSAKIIDGSFSKSLNLSQKLLEFTQKGLQSAKERKAIEDAIVNSQKELAALEKQRSYYAKLLVNATKEEQKEILKILEQLENGVESIQSQVAEAEKLKKEFVEIEKNLGLTGKLLEGIEKIPILNKFIDTKKALAAANEEAGEFTGTRWSVLGATLKSLGESLKKNLTDPLVLLSVGGGILFKMYKLMTHVDQEIVNIGRNFGVGYGQAKNLMHSLEHGAAHSKNLLTTTSANIEAFSELNGMTGTLSDISQENLDTYTNLTKAIGLSKEGAQTFYKFSILSGKSLKQTSSEITGQVKAQLIQNKTALSTKTVMEGLSKTTARQRLSLKGGTEALINSVIQAKKLGLEMSQLEGIADSLLDFESSIQNEMSAELITGRNLNVEAARYYAQTNQTGKLAEVMRKDLGSAAQFQKMGRIEQQMLAQAYGMSAEQVAEMLENQEMLSRLHVSDTDELAKKYAQGKISLEEIKKAGGEELARQTQNISFQEKLNALLDKAKDIFTSQLAQEGGPIDKFLNAVDRFVKGGGMERLVGFIQSAATGFGKALSFLTDKRVLTVFGGLAALKIGSSIKNIFKGQLGSSAMNPMHVTMDGLGSNTPGSNSIMNKISGKLNQYAPGSYKEFTKNGAYTLNGQAYSKTGKILSGGAKEAVFNASRTAAPASMGTKLMRNFGKFGVTKLGKFAGGPGGMIAGALLDPLTGLASDALKGPNGEDNWKSDSVNVLGSTASSALTGAAIGSMIPVVGTAIGGIIGGLWGLGSSLFDIKSREDDKAAKKRQLQKATKQAHSANASMHKSSITQKYMSFAEEGSDGAEGVDKTNALLEQLVGVVSSNRSINMSGNQVGVFTGMESYQMA